MRYKGHIFFSIVIFFLLVFLSRILEFSYGYLDLILLFLITILYGLLPDIDTIRSKIGRIYYFVSLILIVLCFLFSYYFLGIILVIISLYLMLVKHRGFIHTITASLLFSLPLLFVGKVFFIFAFISYTGHLIVDKHIKLY